MMRKIWKWTLNIGLGVFAVLAGYTLCLWCTANAFSAISQVTFIPNETTTLIPIGEFLLRFVGSPIFYIFLADLVLLSTGTAGLIITRKRKNNR